MVLKEISLRVIETLERMGVPGPTIDHILKAEKETLMVFRSLIDAGLQGVDELLGRKAEKQIEKVDIK